MKRYVQITLVAILAASYSCCSMVGDDVTIAKKTLKDGSVIQLDYRGGGATAPDVIWVSKKDTHNKILIGKYKGFEDGYTTEISQINDSIIIKMTDTFYLKGTILVYNLSLKDTIHFNDGSPYAIPRRISN